MVPSVLGLWPGMVHSKPMLMWEWPSLDPLSGAGGSSLLSLSLSFCLWRMEATMAPPTASMKPETQTLTISEKEMEILYVCEYSTQDKEKYFWLYSQNHCPSHPYPRKWSHPQELYPENRPYHRPMSSKPLTKVKSHSETNLSFSFFPSLPPSLPSFLPSFFPSLPPSFLPSLFWFFDFWCFFKIYFLFFLRAYFSKELHSLLKVSLWIRSNNRDVYVCFSKTSYPTKHSSSVTSSSGLLRI